MTLKEMTHALDEKLRAHILQHYTFHNDFDQYRGRSLDKDEAEKVEEIYKKIQASMIEMSDTLHFITFRNETAMHELKQYESFVQELVGAQCLKTKGKNNG